MLEAISIHTPLIVLFIAYALIGMISIKYSKKYNHNTDSINKFTPFISIVIPTYNEERIIEDRLRRLMEIDYPKDKKASLYHAGIKVPNDYKLILYPAGSLETNIDDFSEF